MYTVQNKYFIPPSPYVAALLLHSGYRRRPRRGDSGVRVINRSALSLFISSKQIPMFYPEPRSVRITTISGQTLSLDLL